MTSAMTPSEICQLFRLCSSCRQLARISGDHVCGSRADELEFLRMSYEAGWGDDPAHPPLRRRPILRLIQGGLK